MLQEDSCSSMYKDIAAQLPELIVLFMCCHDYSAMLLSRIIELNAVLIIIVLTAVITCNTLLSCIIELNAVLIMIFSLP
jgi:hypothetical protein